jgi:manganese/zinc/iron transport system permease protein
MSFDLALDLFPLLAATLAAVCCGVLGNFLLLRKQSMMGDAISHSVLPGLVIAFLIVSARSPMVMLTGATIAGIVTVVLVEFVKRVGKVEPGAAMGVVFSILFALGVLLIEKAAVRHVDLDADCVLHGQLETLVWYSAPNSIAGLWSMETIHAVPRQVTTLAVMLAFTVAFVSALFKELRIAAFDPALATTLGFNSTALHYVLMVFVAAATVASFEAVGSILVIAMLICPPATARLLTDRLISQLLISVLVAICTAVGGYFAATIIPGWFDRDTVNAAGSMTVFAGFVLVLAIVLSPSHGVLSRIIRRVRLASRVAMDDLLAAIYRSHEQGHAGIPAQQIAETRRGSSPKPVLARSMRKGYITLTDGNYVLSDQGRRIAKDLVRRHRLWEHYLVGEAGIAPDHVHETAERLEHLPSSPPTGPDIDPHGKQIPE